MSGLTIVDAKIFTLSNSMAIDVFWAQDATGEALSSSKRARLLVMIERTLAGAAPPADELARHSKVPERSRPFQVTPRVLIDNEASSTHTVIEINGRDRPGLLYDVTIALSGLNLQIASSKVSTYGHKAIDVFYVKDVFGLKIVDPSKQARIRAALLVALEDPATRVARNARKAAAPVKSAAGQHA
jgi:[protein-PII] uridylyltransferase